MCASCEKDASTHARTYIAAYGHHRMTRAQARTLSAREDRKDKGPSSCPTVDGILWDLSCVKEGSMKLLVIHTDTCRCGGGSLRVCDLFERLSSGVLFGFFLGGTDPGAYLPTGHDDDDVEFLVVVGACFRHDIVAWGALAERLGIF